MKIALRSRCSLGELGIHCRRSRCDVIHRVLNADESLPEVPLECVLRLRRNRVRGRRLGQSIGVNHWRSSPAKG
jgi:hypothetical protein